MRKKLALVAGVVVLVPLLVIAMAVGISYIPFTKAPSKPPISTTALQATPAQPGAFLDDRYEFGARELLFSGVGVEPKGFTSDREHLAVFRMADALGYMPSNNELMVYNVASGKMVQKFSDVAVCSRVTPDDTVFCTQHTTPEGEIVVWGSEMTGRRLVEINVMTGELLYEAPLPVIPSAGLRYLGESGDHVLLELNSSFGLLSPMESSVHSFSRLTGEFSWAFEFDENKDSTDGCALVDAGARVACVTFGTRELGNAVVSIDVAMGKKVAELRTEERPFLAENGWIERRDLLDGIKIDGSSGEVDTLYNYQGEDISAQFADQLGNRMGNMNLVPAPGEVAAEPIVRYPLESDMQGSNFDWLVINAQGQPILRSDYSMFSPEIDGGIMERISDGRELFTGIPLGVSANGAAVLYTTESFATSATLINVNTGEDIYSIEYGGILPRLQLKFGVIMHTAEDDGTIVLLPGA